MWIWYGFAIIVTRFIASFSKNICLAYITDNISCSIDFVFYSISLLRNTIGEKLPTVTHWLLPEGYGRNIRSYRHNVELFESTAVGET